MLKTLVWPVALYGSGSCTLKANDTDKLKANEMTCYDVCCEWGWTDHGINESVVNEIGADRELVAAVRKQKLQYFGYMIKAHNLCTCILDGPKLGN